MEEHQQGPSLPTSPDRLEDNIAIWSEMNEIGAKYNCLPMGEGAPGYKTPKFLRDFMMQAIDDNNN